MNNGSFHTKLYISYKQSAIHNLATRFNLQQKTATSFLKYKYVVLGRTLLVLMRKGLHILTKSSVKILTTMI